MTGLVKKLAVYASVFVVGGLVVFILGDLIVSMKLPALKPWHTIRLNNEFSADMEADFDWERYLELEQSLFDELESHRQIIEPAIQLRSSRFIHGGNWFQRRLGTDWNRSYRLDAENPRAVALLVHGLSDSPYSLRSIAQLLNAKGVIVYGLRLPGHGTLPSSLDTVVWPDWLAAVRLVDQHIRRQHGELPYFYAGYSTGAALGVKMTLDAIASQQRHPDQLLLFSPALGVNPLARFANLHRVLSHMDRFEKARWLDILPEYDPYKYNSFPKNAGRQISLLVGQIYADIEKLKHAGRAEQLPHILSFQSLVDATVSTIDLIDKLYAVIDDKDSELVLFDVNQMSYYKELISYDPAAVIDALNNSTAGDFRLTLITNRSDSTPAVAEVIWSSSDDFIERPLELEWPEDIYSLSHTSITFPPNDPIYGYDAKDSDGNAVLSLGNLSIRGEVGVLTIPAGSLLRLRSNPFYAYVEQRITDRLLRQVSEPAISEGHPAQ